MMTLLLAAVVFYGSNTFVTGWVPGNAPAAPDEFALTITDQQKQQLDALGIATAKTDVTVIGGVLNIPDTAMLASNRAGRVEVDDCMADAKCARRFLANDYPALLLSTTNNPTAAQVKAAARKAWDKTR